MGVGGLGSEFLGRESGTSKGAEMSVYSLTAFGS